MTHETILVICICLFGLLLSGQVYLFVRITEKNTDIELAITKELNEILKAVKIKFKNIDNHIHEINYELRRGK